MNERFELFRSEFCLVLCYAVYDERDQSLALGFSLLMETLTTRLNRLNEHVSTHVAIL
jgi:hypothetical protein